MKSLPFLFPKKKKVKAQDLTAIALFRHHPVSLRFFEQLSNYSVGAENGSRVKNRTSGPHYSFMALLPTQPGTYLHFNLITWSLTLWSTQTAKVSCLFDVTCAF